MGSSNSGAARLAIVPLPKGTVLLPGVTARIPVPNRPDLSNLLSSLLDQASTGQRHETSISFGCVPLGSPYLSKDGQNLIDDGSLDEAKKEEYEDVEAGQARKEDLFHYGTVGRVIGIQRRVYSEPSLLVQGVQRFSVERWLKERPFFEAEVVLHEEKGMLVWSWTTLTVTNYLF